MSLRRKIEDDLADLHWTGRGIMRFAWRSLPYALIAGAAGFGTLNVLSLFDGSEATAQAAETELFVSVATPLAVFVIGLMLFRLGSGVVNRRMRKDLGHH